MKLEKQYFWKLCCCATLGGWLAVCPTRSEAQPQDSTDIWVTAYYAGWSQGWFNNGVLPAERIDYSAVTHIIHFALVPRGDGTLDADANSIRASNSQALIASAHAAGRKVLICVGGWGTDRAFREATSLTRRSAFISNLVQFVTSRGYDGIDIDWEILEATDAPQYILFIKELRLALDALSPRPLLAAATAWQAPIFAALATEFDQINLMTYDLSGPWQGWVTWHNAPIRDGGFRFFSNGEFPPSADGMISNFTLAGIPASKLGIGIDFYGYIWSGGDGTPTGGVTAPRQQWTRYPNIRPNVPYSDIISATYRPEAFAWDSSAGGAYLSFDRSGNADDKFVSYDNEQSCVEKIEYARRRGIGGVIIWELGGGRLPSSFSNRDRLLSSIRQTLNHSVDAVDMPKTSLPLNFTFGVPVSPAFQWDHLPNASWYRLQIASDSAFTQPIIDQPWIILNTHRASGLAQNALYYWKVQGSTAFATGPWSAVGSFRTTVDSLLPDHWQFIGNTGSNATILIPSGSIPRVGSRPIHTGDAIGVFTSTSGSLTCAGYGLWQEGQSLAITAWGDNLISSVKDGFTEGDSIIFILWTRSDQREHPIRDVRYASGSGRYSTDGVFIVSELTASANTRHAIALHNGWNTISSFVRPLDPDLDRMTAALHNSMSMMKDGSGRVFWPDSGIRTLNTWNEQLGYQIFMTAPDSLVISGDEVMPESTAVSLVEGWNLTAYLRSTPMSPETAFGSLGNNVTLVKNNDGLVYWPSFNVNTIGTLKPGEGYKVHVVRAGILVYPAPPNYGIEEKFHLSSTLNNEPTRVHWQFYPPTANTGTNATLLITVPELQNGDEIAAWTTEGLLVGSCVIRSGVGVLTAWGDNPLTLLTREGASEGDRLILSCWSQARRQESRLTIENARDAFTGEAATEGVTYRSESAVIGRGSVVPLTHFLGQNFPNPFNARTLITYGIAQHGRVVLEVFNLLGQRVAVLQNTDQAPGIYTVPFEENDLPTGSYFMRLQANSFVFTRRMLLLR